LVIGDEGGGGTGSGNLPPKLVAAPGVTINEIAVYQGVKVPLMAGGMPATSQTPIVVGRDAMLRVFVTTDASYNGQPVTARLKLSDTGTPIDVTKTVSGASSDGDLNSTFNIDIPGASITETFQYSVLLGQESAASGGNPGAAYPATGLQPVGAQSSGTTLKVELIPVQYAADGSNRVPDTSPQQLDLYRNSFFGTYPAASVEISVHAPLVWSQTISAFGGGWDTLLNHISDLRQTENVPIDKYFYGIFNPSDSFDQFCGGGCVLGLGNLGQATDNYTHAAIGIGWTGNLSLTTAIHEIGHTHGREHAPCDVSPADGAYPYPGGQIGGWGYDLIQKTLLQPTTADFMGYCEPMWVSDYTFRALFNRMKTVNGAYIHFPAESLDRTYDRVMIGQDGSLKWIAPIKMKTPPMAQTTQVVLETPAGDQSVDGQLYRYDHLAGGVLFWPQTGATYKAMRVKLDGKASRIIR
jgi:hypothetical protein